MATPQEVDAKLQDLFGELLANNPGGIAYRSTTKYNPIREYLAGLLGIANTEEGVYAAGSASRTNQFHVRWTQGQRAGKSMKLGLGFYLVKPGKRTKQDAIEQDIEETARVSVKYVDGSESTNYEAILFFAQVEGEQQIIAKKIIAREGSKLAQDLAALFPNATLESLTFKGSAAAASGGASAGGTPAPETPIEDFDWKAELPEHDCCGLVGVKGAFDAAAAALAAGKHVMLVGPPGTGKTSLARCIFRTFGISHRMHTATAEWTTVDTIGGYFPEAGEKTALRFHPGVIVDSMIARACIIIDEINRADIDRCFGECFTLMSGNSVVLPFRWTEEDGSQKQIELVAPDDAPTDGHHAIRMHTGWRLIGSMNTFDKSSLHRLSYAFMRRFAFVTVDVPIEADYRTLLQKHALAPHMTGAPQAARDAAERVDQIIADLFAADTGLRSVDLAVGPSIPIDALEYALERLRTPGGGALSAQQLVAEALELHLLPQLQGQEERHPELVALFSKLLGDQIGAALSTRLAVWTGYAKET